MAFVLSIHVCRLGGPVFDPHRFAVRRELIAIGRKRVSTEAGGPFNPSRS